MRINPEQQLSAPWRIHDFVDGFRLEDVWLLPAVGEADDFREWVGMVTEFDPGTTESLPARLLWRARDQAGAWFGLGRISTSTEDARPSDSLAETLPADLRATAASCRFRHLPFDSLYLLEDEFAAEMSNATVHGVMHLAWVPIGGCYRPQMSVYVKPRGRLGNMYMALIRPFRYLVVYPALERQTEREWNRRKATRAH